MAAKHSSHGLLNDRGVRELLTTVLFGSDMGGGAWIEYFVVQAPGQTVACSLGEPGRRRDLLRLYLHDPKVQGSSILNREFLTILNAACQHRAGNR